MAEKNNKIYKYSIRRLSIGVVSIVVGAFTILGSSGLSNYINNINSVVYAQETEYKNEISVIIGTNEVNITLDKILTHDVRHKRVKLILSKGTDRKEYELSGIDGSAIAFSKILEKEYLDGSYDFEVSITLNDNEQLYTTKDKKLNKDLFRTELIKKEQTTSVVGSDVDLERIADFKMDKPTVDYIKDLANEDNTENTDLERIADFKMDKSTVDYIKDLANEDNTENTDLERIADFKMDKPTVDYIKDLANEDNAENTDLERIADFKMDKPTVDYIKDLANEDNTENTDLERIADFKMDKSTVDYIKDLANKDDIGLVPAPLQKQKPKLLNEEITLKYEKGSKKDIVIKTDAEILSFVEVRIDGKVLDKSKYEVREGSTIITLKNSYLETLPIGTYELEIVSKATDKFEASSVKTKFVVLEDASKVRSDRKLLNKQNPNTGDFGIMTSAMTLIVAGAALAVTKKKKD